MSSKPSSFYTLASLSLVVVLDTMIMGIVFPLMGALFINPHYAIVPQETSMAMRDFYYSLGMGIFFICTIVGAPFLGDLSDIWGRKKVLLLSLLVGGISCLVAAIAIYIKLVWLFILARAVAGLSAGSQPLAQAAMIDVSLPETKARNISLMALVQCIGFALGPLIGGLFSDEKIFSFSNYATPFFIAAILAFINAIGLILSFKETFIPPEIHKKIYISRGLSLLLDGFKHKNLKSWIWILLIGQLGWAIYFQSISLVLTQYHHYSTGWVGFFMTYLAILFAIGSGLIVPRATEKYNLKNLLLFGFLMASLAMLLDIIFMKFIIMQWLNLIIFVLGQVFIYTSTLTSISNAVDKDRQGWVMGVAAAIGSFAWGIGAFISGGMISINLYLPFILSLILFLVSYYLARKIAS